MLLHDNFFAKRDAFRDIFEDQFWKNTSSQFQRRIANFLIR